MNRLPSPTAVRHNRRTHYVHVESVTVRDARLSYRALGLLTYLLDQKEGWQVRSDQLSKGEGREGREAIRTALRQLAEMGYYRLERRRLRTGKCVMGTAVSEYPVEQWIKDHEVFSTQKDPSVPVVEQQDGTFLVEYPDGTLGSDGFPPGPHDEEPANGLAPESDDEQTAREATTPEEPAAVPPKKRRPRRTPEQKVADDAEKEAEKRRKAEQQEALDAAAEEVAKWWWEHAKKHLGTYAGKTNGYVAMRGMVKRALQAGYTQRQCAAALQHARQHLPSAQQWQTALGVASNHITPSKPSGRVPYSDSATWENQDDIRGVLGGALAANDSDDATFGVITRP